MLFTLAQVETRHPFAVAHEQFSIGHRRVIPRFAVDGVEFRDLPSAAAPLPDMCELDGVVYSSHPTAVRAEPDGYALERRRETVTVEGGRSVVRDLIHLDRLTGPELEQEAAAVGLTALEPRTIPPTEDHVGSEVVILRA